MRELRERTVIKTFLGTVDGRAVLHRWLEFCGVYQSPFATNALMMAHSAGKGDVGRMFLADLIAADEGLYLQMLKEQREQIDG